MTEICDCISPGTHCIHSDNCKYKVPKPAAAPSYALVTLAIKRRVLTFVGDYKGEPNTLFLGRETFINLMRQLIGQQYKRTKKSKDTNPLTYLGMAVRIVDQEDYLAVGLVAEHD